MKVIVSRFVGALNYKGPPIRVDDGEGNSTTHKWDSLIDPAENHRNAVKKLCDKMDWEMSYGVTLDQRFLIRVEDISLAVTVMTDPT